MKKSIVFIIALALIGGFVLVLKLPLEKITPSTKQPTASAAPLSLMQAVELFNQARWHDDGNLADARDTFMTALNEARRNGTIDTPPSSNRQTPLMMCAQEGMRSRVKDLIAAGANPYQQDSDGHDSFWYAENCERDSDIGKNITDILSMTTCSKK